jgi:hypothetical protein
VTLPPEVADLWRLMDEIVAMHNDLYHPGQLCPGEDEDGACHLRTGKPAVLTWTDHGPLRLGSPS